MCWRNECGQMTGLVDEGNEPLGGKKTSGRYGMRISWRRSKEQALWVSAVSYCTCFFFGGDAFNNLPSSFSFVDAPLPL
jgi:hypothetical protein